MWASHCLQKTKIKNLVLSKSWRETKRNKIETVDCPIVNVHGSLDETPADGIVESQKLVISTKSLPFDDWKKTRIYASIAELLYFNKICDKLTSDQDIKYVYDNSSSKLSKFYVPIKAQGSLFRCLWGLCRIPVVF